MDYELKLIRAFEDARTLIRQRRLPLADLNEFAWDKLRRVDVYLAGQQEELGARFFRARDDFSQSKAESRL